jgi:hypothetical protein
MSAPLPVFASVADRDALRKLFEDAGYREGPLRETLGADAFAPGRPDPGILQRRLAGMPALGVLVRLLAGGSVLARAELDAGLGGSGLALLDAVGLLEDAAGDADGAHVRAVVRLVPAGDLWIASDRPDRHRTGAGDFVPGPAPVSRHLAELSITRPVDAALDLGCGCGVIGLGLASHARQVIASDLNPRAAALTRFNATLNRVDHVEVRVGDLFDPVRDRRFDLVVCNPPFVLSPHATYMYRDGGASLSRRILQEAPAYLATGGCLQMLCNWPQRSGQDWRSDLSAWFADEACDAWVLRENSLDALSYAGVWLAQQYPDGIPEDVLTEWVDYLAQEGIDSVGSGLIVVRPAKGRAAWREFRDMPALAPPVGESIARVCAARDRVLRLIGDDALLAARWMLAPDLEYRTVQRPGDDGWGIANARLVAPAGLLFAVEADPVATEIISHLDPGRPLRDAVTGFAHAQGIDPEVLLRGLPAAMRSMAWLGLAFPVDE